MFPVLIYDLARKLIEQSAGRHARIATAESCTGGLIAAALTAIPGASDVFERGFITYSNAAKTDLLDVPPAMIERFGAVSAEVAEIMAEEALKRTGVDLAVSATGIAGPGGGSPAKPVGLVYLGLAKKGGILFHQKCLFKGDRDTIRTQAVEEALRMLLTLGEE